MNKLIAWFRAREVKIDIQHLGAREIETHAEWFSITDKVFKFISWLLMSGVVYGLYKKTNHIVFIICYLVMIFCIGKLVGKWLFIRINIQTNLPFVGSKRGSVFLSYLISIISVFLVNFLISQMLRGFMPP